MAYVDGESLCVQTLLPTAPGNSLCSPLPAKIEQLAWAGSDAIAALLVSGTVVLVDVTRGEPITRTLSMPPATTWNRPPPLDDEGSPRHGADPSGKPHLFARGDEIWLAKCPWWFGFDAGWCHEWVSVQLHPSISDADVSEAEPPGFRELPAPQFDGKPPPDVTITVHDAPAGKAPPLVCERGKTRAVFQADDFGDAPTTVDWSWIPGSSERYVVIVTHDNGEAVQQNVHMMKACEPKPLKEDVSVIGGPDRFWLHDDESGWVALHGDRELCKLRGTMPQFAPPPRP